MKLKPTVRLAATTLAITLISGCGGGSDAIDSTSNPVDSMSGKVIDGYIEGATVCLDLNSNQSCDTDEPSAMTAADGSYKLDTTGLSVTAIRAAHLLTLVPSDAKDADDNGLTLAEAGKKAFALLAPVESYAAVDGSIAGAVISPFTTLVSHDMLSTSASLEAAKASVRSRLSLNPDVDLSQDFIAKENSSLMEQAQVLTAAIGQVKAAAKEQDEALSDRDSLFAALGHLQAQVTDLQRAYQAVKEGNSQKSIVELTKQALADEQAKPNIDGLITNAKRTTTSNPVDSIIGLLQRGIYSVSDDCSLGPDCAPAYDRVLVTNGNFKVDSYSLSDNQWQIADQWVDDGLVLTKDGWTQESNLDCTAGVTSLFEREDGAAIAESCSGAQARISVRQIDMSDKTMGVLEGAAVLLASLGQTMPADSMMYLLDFVEVNDSYTIWPDRGYLRDTSGKSIATLDDFVSAYSTPDAGAPTYMWNNFTFDKTSGKMTRWIQSSADEYQVAGTMTYTRETVHGQDMIVLQYRGADSTSYPIFAVYDGKVIEGDLMKAGTRLSLLHFNKTMVNAVLNTGSYPSVLD